MEANDIVKAAPTALFTLNPFPVLPVVADVKAGDDLEALISAALGGPPDERSDPSDREQAVGIIDVYARGETKLHVHSHPEAFEGLKYAVARMEEEQQIAAMFSDLGMNVQVIRMDGCICGQCGKEDAPAPTSEGDLS